LVYYQLDHLGTPIAAHNAKGEAVWTAEYEAWGRIRNETVSDGLKVNIPFRFQGQYYDGESGLHYNRFRYYDPEIGRFVSQDPIGLMGGMNLFEYAPNPTLWVDPLGLKYRSIGRSQNVLSGKDRTNKSTQNLSEWRRKICRSKIAEERRKFLGDNFVKIAPGKWRSIDGNRQFRIKPDDYLGTHGMGKPVIPNTPHVHFEFLQPKGSSIHFNVVKNIHVPLDCCC